MQNDCAPINFSDDALRAADEITLSQLMEAPGVDVKTRCFLLRTVKIMRDQMRHSSEQIDGDLLVSLNGLCDAFGQDAWNQVFNKQELPDKRETPRKMLTQADTNNLAQEYVAALELEGGVMRFTRQSLVKYVHERGAWGNDVAVIGAMVDNALQSLQKSQMVMNLPSQRGTWLVQSVLQFEETA